MTFLDLSHDVQNGIYDPDDFVLRNSPLLRPLNPRLRPTPSPSPEEPEYDNTRPLPTQGDAVLIGLLGGGKALEVARRVGTENLAADDELYSTYGGSDYEYDVEYLTTDSLSNNHVIASTSPTTSLHGRASIVSMSNDLSPIQNPTTTSEEANILITPLVSSQKRHSPLLAIVISANENGDKNSTSYHQSPISQSSVEPAPSVLARTSRGTVSKKNYSTYTSNEGFKCTHAGCTAKPFQTQYLLKSHTNVHSSDRPFYCPVKGCGRGEGGKGFKRKNEMIRHGLVHESPGYACPYCVDKGRRYPRPDNLQRHVYSQHADKTKDDALLKEILAQRPEGPSRGRGRSK